MKNEVNPKKRKTRNNKTLEKPVANSKEKTTRINKDFNVIVMLLSKWQDAWARSHRGRSILIFLIFTIVPFIWLVYADIIPFFRQSTLKMSGEWNIAVAGFTNIGTDLKPADIELIGKVFSNRFRKEMETEGSVANLVIQIWDNEQVKPITGGSDEERGVNAGILAEAINADVVVYGTVQQNGDVYMLQPEFFVRAENYYEAIELVGEHRFGRPILILANKETLPSQVQLNIELTRRATVLALVARGLSLYLVNLHDQAYELFLQANQENLWSDLEGREFIYLFQGNAAVRLQQFEEAEYAYAESIKIEPEYARGFIGLGNVYYLQDSGVFSQASIGPDRTNLLRAKELYEKALEASIQPESAEIQSKAAFGLGQVYLVQWFLGDDTLNLAIEQFRVVVNNYGNGIKPHLRELASESHARLGVIYRQNNQIDEAVAEFQLAVALSNLPARKGLYLATLSDLYQLQNRIEEAVNASQKAIDQYRLALSLPISNELQAIYWGNIGERYEYLSENDDAIKAYHEALRLLSPDTLEYNKYKARLDILE